MKTEGLSDHDRKWLCALMLRALNLGGRDICRDHIFAFNSVAAASSTIQRMQKLLTEMNIQLNTVLSDLSGLSGMQILGSILDGQRDRWKLAALARPEVKAKRAEIAKSLEGNWREELLFMLRQEVELYQVYQQKIVDCNQQLRCHLSSFDSKIDTLSQPIGPRPKGKRAARMHLDSICARSCIELPGSTGRRSRGAYDGIDVLTAQTVLTEACINLLAFPSEKQFTSWLELCSMNETSGGKVLNRRSRRVVKRRSPSAHKLGL